MYDFFILFLFLACIVLVGVFLILSWYRNKELQALKRVSLRLIAAENDFHYTENGKNHLNQLNRLDLQPGASPFIKNILRSDHGTATIRIFDAMYVVKSGKSRNIVPLIGISIESNRLQLPYFRLHPKLPLDGFTLLRGVNKLESGKLPKLIQSDYSLFYRKRNKPDELELLFKDKDELCGLLSFSLSARLMGFKDRLVYYESGQIKANSSHCWELEQKGCELFAMFCELAPAELKTGKEMKISNQNQSNQS